MRAYPRTKSMFQHAHDLRKKHGKKYKLIEQAVRDFEQTCDGMWNDLVFEMHIKTKLSERTVERIMDSL